MTLVARAEEILDLMQQQRTQMGLKEAVEAARERFVDEEPEIELRLLGEVLVPARQQALIQGRLDDDREQLHHGHLSHEELMAVGHHYEMLRREACEYNHRLRAFIQTYAHDVDRRDLMDWLVTASQGRYEWARAEVTGAVSEVALHAALQGLPEIRGLRYATVEEDLAGYDLVGEWKGRLLTIDAKTGFYQPLIERKHGHRHLELSVPREAVQDLGVTRRGLDLLRQEARQVLGRI